jgi:hypothetical protein
MDAMRRVWRIFYELLLRRPLVIILLSLFYAASFALVPHTPGALYLCAVPTAGIFALANSRASSLSASAAILGVPRHAASIQHVFLQLAAVFIGPLLIYAYLLQLNMLLFAMMLFGAAAFGALPGQVAMLLLLPALGITLLCKWFPSLQNALTYPITHTGILCVSLALLWRWRSRIPELERHFGESHFAPSSASYEAQQAAVVGQRYGDLSRYDRTLDGQLSVAIEGLTHRGPSVATLAFGLNCIAGSRPKWLAIGIALACAAQGIWHFFRPDTEMLSYWILVALLALTVVARLLMIHQSLHQCTVEQSLLKLSPRWPENRRIKWLFVRAVSANQFGSWVMGTALSVSALLWHIVERQQVWIGLVILLAACSTLSAMLAVRLVARAAWEVKLSTPAIIALNVCGAVWFAVTRNAMEPIRYAGPLLIVLLLVLAAAASVLRPLQFPVIRIH